MRLRRTYLCLDLSSAVSPGGPGLWSPWIDRPTRPSSAWRHSLALSSAHIPAFGFDARGYHVGLCCSWLRPPGWRYVSSSPRARSPTNCELARANAIRSAGSASPLATLEGEMEGSGRAVHTLQGVSLDTILFGHVARLSTTCILPRHSAWWSCNSRIIETCLAAGSR